ncbi:hypothetical protein D7D52_20600 [Nocardia yunnanensis]|uniref:Uncharacterized protein n=1 Tax=Nocardia yunnanensis TaxID=2382165 RepID=A0A386ZFD5_9NOCA|nr:hypothetical protein D7D52_20600 [Nocardia yunnanensis]
MRDMISGRGAGRRGGQQHRADARVAAVWPEPSPLQDWWDTVMYGPAAPEAEHAETTSSAES